MLARGPAPHVSHLPAKSAASGVPGRDSRVMRLAKANTTSETGTRRPSPAQLAHGWYVPKLQTLPSGSRAVNSREP